MTATAAWAHRFNRRRLRITPIERIRTAAEMRTIQFDDPPLNIWTWWMLGATAA